MTARLARLRAMSIGEMAQRLGYAARIRVERAAYRDGRLARPDRLRRALVPALRRSTNWKERLLASRQQPPPFFAGAADQPGMRDLFGSIYRSELSAAVAEADRVLEGEVAFFGRTFPLRVPVPWNNDPMTGAEWPRAYHRDVPIHGGNRGYGDVKYVWELNRHQFLIDLGRASFLTGDAKYAAGARALVADWIAANPYATGVNWACALEPAFRVWSWLWTYYLCLEEERHHPEHHVVWLTSFYDHGRFLHRHLEHYASPFNHLIGEAAALYALGVLFPEFREAQAWRRRGREVLEGRLGGQFYGDGGTVEQSTFYHHATLGFYMLAAVLGRRHGEEFSPAVWQAIERGIAFSMALVQPDGKVPSIGGADDGKPLRMEHLPLWDFRPFQSIGAVLFGRGDFKAVAGRFHEDAVWLLGPAGRARFDEVPAVTPPATSLACRPSGYYVLRSDWSEKADYVCVDCGEQAGEVRTDDVPNSVHGHADCLSIVVWLGGRPVLVDSGLFCYNGEPEWESHFRRTAAHSTARVDGADQALHLGKMAWSHSYEARPELWSDDSGGASFMGSHDGYMRRGGDTVHRRLVWLRPDGYVVIYDEFACHREHDLELTFQFAPGDLRVVAPGVVVYGDDVCCAWTGSAVVRPTIREGGPAPSDGWIAPSLGVRVPAPRLTLAGRIQPGAAFLTVIASRGATTQSAIDAGESAANGMLRVSGREFEDYVGAPAISGDKLPGATDGRVAIWRFRSGRNIEAAQIGGTHASAAAAPRSA